VQQSLFQLTLVVHDYDEAISFYAEKLNFELLEDTPLTAEKRWVRMQPPGGSTGASLLLAKAKNAAQAAVVGQQTGGRVFLFLHTDDIDRDYRRLLQQQVTIVREPSVEAYGKVCVFADLYGNLWDLIQPTAT